MMTWIVRRCDSLLVFVDIFYHKIFGFGFLWSLLSCVPSTGCSRFIMDPATVTADSHADHHAIKSVSVDVSLSPPSSVKLVKHALHIWRHVMERELLLARDLAKHGEELWCRDHEELIVVKRHLQRRHKASEDDLKHLDMVAQREAEWAQVEQKAKDSLIRIEGPWKDLIEAEKSLKEDRDRELSLPKDVHGSFRLFPITRKRSSSSSSVGSVSTCDSNDANFSHQYKKAWKHYRSQISMAHHQHVLLTRYPGGLLTKVGLLHQSILEEINRIKELQK